MRLGKIVAIPFVSYLSFYVFIHSIISLQHQKETLDAGGLKSSYAHHFLLSIIQTFTLIQLSPFHHSLNFAIASTLLSLNAINFLFKIDFNFNETPLIGPSLQAFLNSFMIFLQDNLIKIN